jgi:hypothetical protein
MKRWLLIGSLLAAPVSAQAVPDETTRCFRVWMVPTVPDRGVDPSPREFLVEFQYAPDFRTDAEPWVVPDPDVRAEARWWVEEDQVIAVWRIGADLLALRLQADDEELRGHAYRSLEFAERRGEIRARPEPDTPCVNRDRGAEQTR